MAGFGSFIIFRIVYECILLILRRIFLFLLILHIFLLLSGRIKVEVVCAKRRLALIVPAPVPGVVILVAACAPFLLVALEAA